MPEEKSLHPFVVDFVVTYRGSILVYAEDEEAAEEYASDLYENGEYDPERNGYDGAEITATPGRPADLEAYKRETYYADEEGDDT